MPTHYQTVICRSIPFGDSDKLRIRPHFAAMDIQEIRRRRLAQLIDEQYGGSQANFVEKTNENQGEVSALLRSKSFGEKKARKLEEKCGLPKYWFDGEMAPLTASAQARAVAKAFDALPPPLQQSLISVIEGFGVKVERAAPEPVLQISETRESGNRTYVNEQRRQQNSGSS